MEKVFKEQSKNIRIYLATETMADPFEKNIILNELNPFPLKAIVIDLTTAQVQWKMQGIEVSRAKEIILEKKYRSFIEKSQRIEVDSQDYYGWKDNAGRNIQIREDGNYIRFYIYSK